MKQPGKRLLVSSERKAQRDICLSGAAFLSSSWTHAPGLWWLLVACQKPLLNPLLVLLQHLLPVTATETEDPDGVAEQGVLHLSVQAGVSGEAGGVVHLPEGPSWALPGGPFPPPFWEALPESRCSAAPSILGPRNPSSPPPYALAGLLLLPPLAGLYFWGSPLHPCLSCMVRGPRCTSSSQGLSLWSNKMSKPRSSKQAHTAPHRY